MSYLFSGRLSRFVLRGTVSLFLLLLAGPALGDKTRAQEKAARKACLIGDYKQGVSILADIFVETGNPVVIFNQGRCYEQNQRYGEAIAKFEEFLRLRVPRDAKAIAEKHIAECRDKRIKEQIDSSSQALPVAPPAERQVVEPTPRPEALPVPAPRPSEPAVDVARPAASSVTGERRWGLVTAGIVTGVVGAGGIVAGVIFNLKARTAARDLESKVDAYPARSNDEKDSRTYAWIGYGVGAACLAAGAVLIAVGAVRSNPGSSREFAFVPAVGPDQVGAMLTGVF